MTAKQVYENTTGRPAERIDSSAHPDYVEWLERIVLQVADMLDIAKISDASIYDQFDIEDLHDLFERIN